MFDYLCQFHLISIHAPIRGATQLTNIGSYPFDISIHAPIRGATGEALGTGAYIIDFNPRSYKRSDNQLTILVNNIS